MANSLRLRSSLKSDVVTIVEPQNTHCLPSLLTFVSNSKKIVSLGDLGVGGMKLLDSI